MCFLTATVAYPIHHLIRVPSNIMNSAWSPSEHSEIRATIPSTLWLAVIPLPFILVTTLPNPSGEVILTMSQLRNMCGTARSDMRTIFSVMELLLDTANSVIFTPGWYQDGKLLLANGRRNKILNTTVRQLRSLSPSTMNSFFHHRSHSLLSSYNKEIMMNHNIMMDHTNITPSQQQQQHLAEWEVRKVDEHIRNSINSIFTKDWTKICIVIK